ncbi:MAG TPA: DinB family protein [Lapillicoccus sp.]|nr:DinB family protein [Lapillicoccus sp.]
MSDPLKTTLHTYLTQARDGLRWKVEGLSEYDARRPLTRTGTNLLGLVKHASVVEAWYFGDCFDRPFLPHLPWWDGDAAENADLWATADESRDHIFATYRAATDHADRTIDELDLGARGRVPWWSRPEVTLHTLLVHVLAETSRHAGHADILREQLDGRAGMRSDNLNLDPHDDQWWQDYVATVEAAARGAARRT